jgi:hypothetical protein
VGFEPTIAVLERAKTVRALDRAATAIGETRIKIIFQNAADIYEGPMETSKLHLLSERLILTGFPFCAWHATRSAFVFRVNTSNVEAWVLKLHWGAVGGGVIVL